MTCTHDQRGREAENGNGGEEEKRTTKMRRKGKDGRHRGAGTGKSVGPPRRSSLLLIPTGVSFVSALPSFTHCIFPSSPFLVLFSKHAFVIVPSSLDVLPSRIKASPHGVFRSPSCHVIEEHSVFYATGYPENQHKIVDLYVYRITMLASPSTHHRFLPLSFVSSATSPSSSFVFPLSSSLTEVLFRLSVLSPCFCEYLWRSMDSICPTWLFCFGLKASTRSKRKRLTDQETNWSEWSKKIDYGGIGGQSWGRDLVSNEFSPLSILASAGPSGNYVGRSRVL